MCESVFLPPKAKTRVSVVGLEHSRGCVEQSGSNRYYQMCKSAC